MALVSIQITETNNSMVVTEITVKKDDGSDLEYVTAKMVGKLLAMTILPELLPEIIKTAQAALEEKKEKKKHEHTTH
ncbi:MAG: hypothetical protein ACTH5B_21180 [Marinomonas sp.]|uniref:hypothetical protein n=1 Tax=Marinomonas sp. TaxID=1904862 RepID=UPI003F9E26C3